MPPLLFPLPTTSTLSFSSTLHDPASSHTTSLAEATNARTKLHLALKAVAEGAPGSSALAVVDAVQVYLPFLRGIIGCLEADELLYKGDPVFQWRPSLTQSPSIPFSSVHSEHLFVLVSYTLALSNHAHSILQSLPTFESLSSARTGISTEDQKRITAGLARAVDLLCQASGVAEWTAENVCMALEGVKKAGKMGRRGWPLESGAEGLRGLAMVLLADAHVTAIRKLFLPVLSHTLFSPPGPPLPANHPSASLLGKLYLHVASLYTSALAMFKIHQSESSSAKMLFRSNKVELDSDSVEGEVIPAFKRYLRKEALLSTALAHKWLGVEAGELGNGQRLGEAVAWVLDAQNGLEELEDGKVREKMKGLGLGKGNEKRKEERKGRQGRVERELEDIRAWSRAYQKINDTVAFQPVPLVSSLNKPSGRPIFAAKPFKPPASRFGPTNAADGEAQHIQERDETYAGRGTYY